jgi:hypothetical protein
MGICSAYADDGTLVYRDNLHISVPASIGLIEQFTAAIDGVTTRRLTP